VTNQRLPIVAAAALLSVLCAAPDSAQTPLTTELVASGASAALFLTGMPGDSTKLIVVQQGGRIRVAKGGQLLSNDLLNLTSKVSAGAGERGLLGFAFDPNYEQNGYAYASYTRTGNHASVVERYSRDPLHPALLDPNSGVIIFGPVSQPFSNHNGGGIAFGPDDKLYLGLGDGGAAGDPGCRAQDPSTYLGKMLRMNTDGSAPSDNPFVGVAGSLDLIWATGLRNPWRFSFDRVTGDLWVADVGQGSREEINVAPGGGPGGDNYGWKVMEGFNCYGTGGCPSQVANCNSPSLKLPVHDYGHGQGRCSVTGGYAYRGCKIPDLQGTYFFADYCSDDIYSMEYDGTSISNLVNRTNELDPVGSASIRNITSFGEDLEGELYIIEGGNNAQIWKVVASVPELSSDVSSISASAGGTQTLALSAGTCDLAGQPYLLLGSASGTAPGVPIQDVILPLAFPDPWFSFTLQNPNTAPLGNSFGILDAGASGASTFTLPPGSPAAVVGLTLNHAFLGIDLSSGGGVTFASNAVPVQLTL